MGVGRRTWTMAPARSSSINPVHSTIPLAAERFMAAWMHAHTMEVDSSHVAMVSHPGALTDLNLSAVQATQ